MRVTASIIIQCGVLIMAIPAYCIRQLLNALSFEKISFWTGTPILTLAQKAASERLLNFKSIVVVRYTYHLSEGFDIVLSRFCGRLNWLVFPLAGITFLWMLCTASRVHTFADGGMLPATRHGRVAFAELFLYRLFGIPHLVWTYGGDVRTRERTLALGEYNCCTNCTKVRKACVCRDSVGSDNIQRLQRYGSIVFSMGDMLEYTQGSCNDLFFWPLDIEGIHSCKAVDQTYRQNDAFRIVHAPNHREYKGTKYLEEAIAALRAEGVSIELFLVEGIPNLEAIEIYRTADLIFDQCLIGFHGYFALEAMALGKPVMCYIRKPNEYLLNPKECPIINTHVDTLKEDLRRLVTMQKELTDIGRQGRKYVEKYYSRTAFSERLMRAYKEKGIVV